jgi:eukaryotic-like serine/threonine-protein kinase
LAGVRLGDYDLLEEIGRGGMGVVYRAHQRSLDRVVAVKLMARDLEANPELVKRFQTEALSAAQLRHPHIVAIHEVGFHEGRHFFAMDYVPGQNLAKKIGHEPLPAPRAVAYLISVADAVHKAHEQGILHRDLKPSNILIDAQDQPLVVDFGLARLVEAESDLTLTGQVLGSPRYLSPEQALGQKTRISRQTDVYALGATLYHMLTGRSPFQADTVAQTLNLVLQTEPIAPRLLNPSVPQDLETICLKCLEKEPSRRYPTAQELADELKRFQAGEPIRARPVGVLGKAWRWCQRKPQMASLAAAAVVIFLLGLAGILWQLRRVEKSELAARRALYAAHINMAQSSLEKDRAVRAQELLEREVPTKRSNIDLRGWEWRYLWQQSKSIVDVILDGFPHQVRDLEISRDGLFLAASSVFGAVKVWDLTTMQAIDLEPECSLESLMKSLSLCESHIAFIPDTHILMFSAQGSTKPGTIARWHAGRQQLLEPWSNPGLYIGAMVFSQNGHQFAYEECGIEDCDRRIIAREMIAANFLPGREIARTTCRSHGGLPLDYQFVFTPNEQQILLADTDDQIGRWHYLEGSEPQWSKAFVDRTAAIVNAMAISPDGKILAVGTPRPALSIKLWSLPALDLLKVLTNHQDLISDLKFSPDGRTLASCSEDTSIRLWDTATWKEKRNLRGYNHRASRICFSADSKYLYSGGVSEHIFRWPIEDFLEIPNMTVFRPNLARIVLSPNASQFAGFRDLDQKTVCLGYTWKNVEPLAIPELGTNNTSLLFSRDGLYLFAGTRDEIKVWSLRQHKLERILPSSGVLLPRHRQDETGQFLCVYQRNTRERTNHFYQVQLWNTSTWQIQDLVKTRDLTCSLSPNRKFLATVLESGYVDILSVKNNQRIKRLGLPGNVTDIAFSPDGRFLVASTFNALIKVFDLINNQELPIFRAHSLNLTSIAFSPDSTRLATCSQDDEALRLWDVNTWELLITLKSQESFLTEPTFTSDGNGIVAVNNSGKSPEILMWRAPQLADIDRKSPLAKTR